MPTPEELLDAAMGAAAEDDYIGICIECGNQQEGCEPDARRYKCEDCGRLAVFGAEEIIIMDVIGIRKERKDNGHHA